MGQAGDDILFGDAGLNTLVSNPGETDFPSGASTGDTVMDFVTGTSRIDFASGPTTAKDVAAVQAVAQGLLGSTVSYAFVSNGTDGYLFTTGGTGTAITDAAKLAGAGTGRRGDMLGHCPWRAGLSRPRDPPPRRRCPRAP